MKMTVYVYFKYLLLSSKEYRQGLEIIETEKLSLEDCIRQARYNINEMPGMYSFTITHVLTSEIYT